MANHGDWVDAGYVACPDDEFESMLAAHEAQKNDLFEVYTSGCRYATACIGSVLNSVRLLYGEEVRAQIRFYLHNDLQDEATLQILGASWHLCSTVQHSRIDYLGELNIDLRDFLENMSIDCSEVVRLWDPNADSADNLELISVHIETVHGLTYERDFRALLREVESDHSCLLDAVVSILKQQYGDFGLWRHEARRRRSAGQPPADWNAVLV
jgi:hypothetical protein